MKTFKNGRILNIYTMDIRPLIKEQRKYAARIKLQDAISKPKTIGGAATSCVNGKLVAAVAVIDAKTCELIEKSTYVIENPLPYRLHFEAYRDMPAILEAFNLLENDPDILIVKGNGILHPQKCGLASHIGLSLNIPTIGVSDKLTLGVKEEGKIYVDSVLCAIEITTREHANPLYVSPGYLVCVGTAISIVKNVGRTPHKLPEPIHIAHKIAKKLSRKQHDVKTN